MSGWGGSAEDPTWTEIGEETPGPATSAGRSQRPTAYGLPPVTHGTSDLRATISDVLTTKAPAPLIRLANRVTEHPEAEMTVETTSDAEPVEPGSTPETESTAAQPARPAPSPIEKLTALTSERPEFAIGAAFLGGLLLATILKRFARR